jgi:CRP-like cAMP-binding protein
MEFFKQFTGRKEEIHKEICKHMSFEYYTTGKIIFYQGDAPDKFYMLLKGKIAVLIRKSDEELKFLNIQHKNPPKSKGFLNSGNPLGG